MAYRTDERPGGCATALLLLLFCAVMYSIDYFEDIKPRKNFIERETKSVLDCAHKQAKQTAGEEDIVAFYTDKDYYTRTFDIQNAKQDSAQLTKKMREHMDRMIEDTRFNDYIKDTASEYTISCKKGIIVDSANNQIGRTSSHKTVYGLKRKFNIDKAMADQSFKETYNKYLEAIKQLELARLQRDAIQGLNTEWTLRTNGIIR